MRPVPPPRLFVIFARDAFEAVIFRRGPSKGCQIIRWDTNHDKFYEGAWIKGRIFTDGCDLSPDGGLLLYSVHQGRSLRTEYTDSWTAVSRSPWLHALALWPFGTTYGGGGRFIDNRTIIIRNGYDLPTHPDHPADGLNVSFGNAPYHGSDNEIDGAEWSGRDQRNRLVYTDKGQLFYRPEKSGDDICLMDFCDSKPDPQPAPEYATRPLDLKGLSPKPKKNKR